MKLRFQLYPKQLAFIQSDAFETLYGGAAGGGKSFVQIVDALVYSDMPGNLMGQVCPQFSVAWFFLSAAAIKLENELHRVAEWIAHRRGR